MRIRTMEDVLRDDYTRIGKVEGKTEGKIEEKQETTIRPLKKGTSIDLIQIATELSITAINDIAKSLKLPIAAPTSS